MPIRNAFIAPQIVVNVSSPAPPSVTPPPPPLSVRLRRAALTAAFFAVLGGLLSAKAVPCAFAKMFHLPCPGCGSTRAVLALLHGDVDSMVRFNPIGPAAAVLIGVLVVQAFASVLARGDFRAVGEGRIGLVVKRGLVAVVVLEVLVWIARFLGAFGGPLPV